MKITLLGQPILLLRLTTGRTVGEKIDLFPGKWSKCMLNKVRRAWKMTRIFIQPLFKNFLGQAFQAFRSIEFFPGTGQSDKVFNELVLKQA